ncbi:hypothetical protein BAUCODRAFT_30320 [Baudoinia panamericana UAMH 10762]|uniref:Uncharacterized protein n=1 Tax=Baudoinia panamericana (strain UAMH 10762) TaxID=717646 RepID=M2LYX7_BAUPA|nr:uncharacterized protein BAUCODRAFT_30320 [Baudoinia panamericana UAMH 10762]EMC99902.1 hypothetical protein BAUCODRAFT_30320 [Baudoinia panamericana UAMH 10762]
MIRNSARSIAVILLHMHRERYSDLSGNAASSWGRLFLAIALTETTRGQYVSKREMYGWP